MGGTLYLFGTDLVGILIFAVLFVILMIVLRLFITAKKVPRGLNDMWNKRLGIEPKKLEGIVRHALQKSDLEFSTLPRPKIQKHKKTPMAGFSLNGITIFIVPAGRYLSDLYLGRATQENKNLIEEAREAIDGTLSGLKRK